MLTVVGRVTETCSAVQPLAGYRVDVRVRAFGLFGITTRTASVTAAADGSYSAVVQVSVGPIARFGGVFVSVGIASPVTSDLVATRETRPWLVVSEVVRVDVAVEQCVTQSTPIRVVMGPPVSGAEVFVNGIRRGVTGRGVAPGLLFVSPPLTIGDALVARKLVWERATDRAEHGGGSNQNWNYRVYITSAPLEHDPQTGDNAALRPALVTEPFAEHILTLDRANPLIGFHLRMSVEWDASASMLANLRDALPRASDGLFNATDGQMFLERVELTDDKTFWEQADLRVYANLNQSSNANLIAILGSTGYIHLNRGDATRAGTVVHEFGHYAMNLGDEYASGSCWTDARAPGCTEASRLAGDAYGSMGAKASCVMGDGLRMTKLCSTHADNPHVLCTGQGASSCWDTLLSTYRDWMPIPRWVLRGPAQRSVILGPLTVPFQDWETQVPITDTQQPSPCVDLRVRFTYQGTNVNGLKVYLRLTNGNLLYQGKTNAWPSQNLGDGEAWVVGAHVGDEVTAFGSERYGSHVITAADCAAGVVIQELIAFPFSISASFSANATRLRVQLRSGRPLATPPSMSASMSSGRRQWPSAVRPGEARGYEADLPLPRGVTTMHVEAVARALDGEEVKGILAATFGTLEKSRDAVRSADGHLTVETDGTHGQFLVVIADTLDSPAMIDAPVALMGPYQVTSSRGELLSTPMRLTLQLDPALRVPLEVPLDLFRFDERVGRWTGLGARAEANRAQYSASSAELGLFILARGTTR